jgi:hypothetical protein
VVPAVFCPVVFDSENQDFSLLESIKNSCGANSYASIKIEDYEKVGKGCYYINNNFTDVKPYDSWILNTDKYIWEAPIPYPIDGNIYNWNEETASWIEIEKPTE